MEAGFVVLIAILMLVIGVLIGILVSRTKQSDTESLGDLYVNCDATEGQGLFLAQLAPTSVIASKKRVTFNVFVIK